MSTNTANSQRPSRADPARKSTFAADTDRRAPASAPTPPPPRSAASPPPGQYPRYTTGFHSAHPQYHHHQHHAAHQSAPGFAPYANPPPSDAYGYAGPHYHPGRHGVDSVSFARGPASRSHSQSSASGSTAAPHEAVAASHYTPHFSPSFPAYAPYPGAFYTPPPAAPATHNASSTHPTYQQAYADASLPATPGYGVQATPPTFNAPYPYHLHAPHYAPPHGHLNTHAHASASGRASRAGPQHASTRASRDSASGAASRRQSNHSSRSDSAKRRTSSNSSGNTSSPLPASTGLPHRPPSSALDLHEEAHESAINDAQPSDLVEAVTQSNDAAFAVSGLPSEADLDSELDASTLSKAAERVPGSGLRPHYHPQQGPRSEWVLWCGNVPQDATVEELWEVFSRLTSDEYHTWLATPEGQEHAAEASTTHDDLDADDHGVVSIFIISRSNCAFVNYASLAHLDRAVKYFHGKQVRPRDAKCPKLVCRVRKKDDEAQAGVAGQRGRGIHVAWLKQQRELDRASQEPAARQSTEPLSSPPPISKDAPLQVAGGLTSAASYSSSGSASYASTNSSLFRHPAFRHRFFILKSLRADDLDRSIETGYWATQPHNESVLDQAYRNSETVYLVFGVNSTGQFHGYAKMAGPIYTPTNENRDRRRASLSSVLSAASGSQPPATIPESADENATELDASRHVTVASPESGLRQAHPTLEQRDIEAARGLFSALTVDGDSSYSQAMTSPLPISPTLEEPDGLGSGIISPDRKDTITPQTAGAFAQSSTWPYTSLKKGGSGGGNSTEADAAERPKLATTLSADHSAGRVTAEPDEYGVRRIDTEAESTHTNSSQSDQPSLAPSDSASWSSADPRVAEQIALRAVIHNLRLDEMESRGQAEILENQLRSTSTSTRTDATDAADTFVTGKSASPAVVSGQGESPRSPPRQSSSDSWGKPFRVEWIRTDPLPFQRVKKLRNPWRDNRQVKVSRDGTELEPGVGRQLLEEWNRLHAAVPVDSTKASSKKADGGRASSTLRSPSDEDE